MQEKSDYPPQRRGIMLVLAAVLLALGMLGSAYLLSRGNSAPIINVSNLTSTPNVYVSSIPPDNPISVSATATQQVSPDLLLINLRIATVAPLAAKSQSDNANVAAALRSKLAGIGIDESNLTSTSYDVQPVYESQSVCPAGGGSMMPCNYDSVLTGYRTTQLIEVRLTDLKKGGNVIDVASTAGTNQTFVDSISFGLQDQSRNQIELNLLKNASMAAKIKAQNIASGLGISLGKVLSASQSSNYNYPQPLYSFASIGARAPSQASTQLSSGNIEVDASVSVSYQAQ